MSLPVGEDRTTITFNFFIEVRVVGSLPHFYRSKREIAGLEKPLEEKPVPQTRVWLCFCCLTLISVISYTNTLIGLYRGEKTKKYKTKNKNHNKLCSYLFISAVWLTLLHTRCKMKMNQAGHSRTPQHFIWNYNSKYLIQTTHFQCVFPYWKMRSSLMS